MVSNFRKWMIYQPKEKRYSQQITQNTFRHTLNQIQTYLNCIWLWENYTTRCKLYICYLDVTMPKLELMLYDLGLVYWASHFYFIFWGGEKIKIREDLTKIFHWSRVISLILCCDYCLFILCTIKGEGVVRFYSPIKIYLPYRYCLHLHSAIIIHILVCIKDILSYIIQWNGTQYLSIFLKAILTII